MSSAEGRGRRRRKALREGRQRRAAVRWWTQPGVLLFLSALLLAGAGVAVVVHAGFTMPVRQGTIGGLHVAMSEARWVLDQMDHGENFQKPSTMMPDMPEWGKQRLTLSLAFENRSGVRQVYDGSEFVLVPQLGEPLPPMGAQVGRAELAPGQSFNTAVHFDFDASAPHGRLVVEWRRDGRSLRLPVPEPAEHYHLRPRGGEIALPPRAELLLPIGDADRGEGLFAGRYGCSACHGLPRQPGTNAVGPHLGGIATAAAGRIDGVSAAQYIYDSILDPGAFIAPECERGRACAEPSAMPEYASLVRLEDVADLLSYLLDQVEESQG